jgi:hypothetical protein
VFGQLTDERWQLAIYPLAHFELRFDQRFDFALKRFLVPEENTKWSGVRPLSHSTPPQVSGRNAPLQAVCGRLEDAVAILIVARQTLLAQAADHDLEIARCLAHVVGLVGSEIDRLRRLATGPALGTLAAGISPEIVRPVGGAEGSSSDRRPMTADQKERARHVHRTLDQLEQEKETKRRSGVRSEEGVVRSGASKTPAALRKTAVRSTRGGRAERP